MTTNNLDYDITRLERLISAASDIEKAKVAARLRTFLKPRRTTRSVSSITNDIDDDLFDNMPI